MTWWYRWLCRLSGVLGAFCEYRSGRGGPSCRPPRMRARRRPAPPARPRRKGSESGRGQRGTRGVQQWQGQPERGPWRLPWLPAGAGGSWTSALGPRGAPSSSRPGHCPSAPRSVRTARRPLRDLPSLPAGRLPRSGRQPRLCTGAGGAATFGRTLFVSGRAQVWPDILRVRCWPEARQVVPKRRLGGELREVAAPRGPHCALGGRCVPCGLSSASPAFISPPPPTHSGPTPHLRVPGESGCFSTDPPNRTETGRQIYRSKRWHGKSAERKPDLT